MVHSMVIPYGFHSGYGMGKWVRAQPKIFHMESMEWGVESTHSIWKIPGSVKTSLDRRNGVLTLTSEQGPNTH
jgi:hypothetical protein